jgi:hypothetical protein
MRIPVGHKTGGMVLPMGGEDEMSEQKNAHSGNSLQYNGAL